MRYLEHTPSTPLRPFVRCYWTLDAAAGELGSDTERILPDGCIEVIFNAGSAFERLSDDGRREHQPKTLVIGPTTRHLFIRPTGTVRLVGLRFRHAGATPFIRSAAHELTDLTPELHALGPVLDSRDTEARLAESPTPVGAVEVLERVLLSQLNRWKGDLRRAQWAASQALASRGAMSVRALAAATNVGRRQLERMFQDTVGIAPRTLLRLSRFQHAVRVIEQRSTRATGLAALAAECGYYDQAHFTRDFREFAGLTPAAYAEQRHPLSELFVLGGGTSPD